MKVGIALAGVSSAMRHALIQAGSLAPSAVTRSQRHRRSDAEALASDWAKVGRDLYLASRRGSKAKPFERAG